jgi:hypothetical protein
MDELEVEVRNAMVAHEHEARSGSHLRAPTWITERQRRSPWRPSTVAASIVVAVAAAASAFGIYEGTRSTNPAVDGIPTCGSLPRSHGDQANRIRLAVIGPNTAPGGTTIHPEVQARSLTGRAESLSGGGLPEIVIVRDGRIVGEYSGATAGLGFAIAVPATGHVTLTDVVPPVLLSGCPSQDDGQTPNASRRELPPGDYGLVAVVADGKSTIYASPPASIRVT